MVILNSGLDVEVPPCVCCWRAVIDDVSRMTFRLFTMHEWLSEVE